MSTLKVANVHLESTGNNRLQYTGSNSAALIVAGANAINITSAGNVGIGTSAPDQKLQVAGNIRIADYGAIGPVSNTTGIVIHGGNNISGNPLQSGIIFRGNTGGAGGTASNGLEFYANGAQTMRLESGGNLLMNSGYGSAAVAYGCRAWANWDGRSTGTITPRASGGVTSVTKITTGSYSINFNFTMPDVNYSVSGAVGNTAYSSGSVAALTVVVSNMTTTYANVFTVSHGSNSIDFQYVNVSIVR